MSNINKADDAKLNVESKADAITYMRQLHCHHSMVKGRCDDVERCVHCGVSKTTLLSWDAAFHHI